MTVTTEKIVTSDKLQVTGERQTSAEGGTHGYRKLRVWHMADRLAHEVYRVTKDFLKSEQFGLVVQLRRAALSVPTNLAEGHARKGRREFKQFVGIALGSLAEVEYLLEFSREEGFLSGPVYRAVESTRQETGKLLWSFYESLWDVTCHVSLVTLLDDSLRSDCR